MKFLFFGSIFFISCSFFPYLKKLIFFLNKKSCAEKENFHHHAEKNIISLLYFFLKHQYGVLNHNTPLWANITIASENFGIIKFKKKIYNLICDEEALRLYIYKGVFYGTICGSVGGTRFDSFLYNNIAKVYPTSPLYTASYLISTL